MDRRNNNADAGAAPVPQNPFEDPQNILGTSTAPVVPAPAVHQPSGQPLNPFSDTHATKDEAVKASSNLVRETSSDADPFGDTNAVEFSSTLAARGTATPSNPALPAPYKRSVTVDDVVEQGWELRSGPVDELSDIEEVKSKEEREAERGT